MADKFNIEYQDIQSFVVRGFGHLGNAGYAFFTITDAERFLRWLDGRLEARGFIPASARKQVAGPCSAIGFSAQGMDKLAGEHLVAESLPPEFLEGMVQEHRSRLLGDVHENDPGNWRWGSCGAGTIDGVLMTFAADSDAVDGQLDDAVSEPNGMWQVTRLMGQIPADGKEPFGFADGISQPVIDGTERAKTLRAANPTENRLHVVPPGELILGYEDGSGRLPRTLAISAASDPKGLLRAHWERPEQRDFGRNGSFIVIRQMAQDVAAFARFVAENTPHGSAPDEFAAKLVGRNKDGTPLALGAAPDHRNGFDYLTDPQGLGCPIGAHIRRANPRSTVHAALPEEALEVTNRHRILRRGRVYRNGDGEQGLLFICLNASISRQFEFVQSTWCNNALFQGLQEEVDPIIGSPHKAGVAGSAMCRFTIPRRPYRHRVANLPSWVTVKGGAYLFLPSLSALHVLAGLPTAR